MGLALRLVVQGLVRAASTLIVIVLATSVWSLGDTVAQTMAFATFCFAVVVSFALNGYSDSKEAGFLFLSLFAYLAGRFAPVSTLFAIISTSGTLAPVGSVIVP